MPGDGGYVDVHRTSAMTVSRMKRKINGMCLAPTVIHRDPENPVTSKSVGRLAGIHSFSLPLDPVNCGTHFTQMQFLREGGNLPCVGDLLYKVQNNVGGVYQLV